jgi:hypothetical protein
MFAGFCLTWLAAVRLGDCCQADLLLLWLPVVRLACFDGYFGGWLFTLAG